MSDVAAAEVEAKAWTQWFKAPASLTETAQEMIRQGLDRNDVRLECLGLFFAVRPLIAAGADDETEPALDFAEQRCFAAGQVRVLRLVNDQRAGLWLRRGELEKAWQLANAADQRSETARGPVDQTLSALGLAEIALQRADFDQVLEHGYRALRCAEATEVPAAKAIALHNLAANQLSLLNLEDALPLQQEAQVWLERAQMAFALPYVWENLILIHDVQGRQEEAAQALAQWRAHAGEFSAQTLHAQGVAIALGLLASGEPALALPIVQGTAHDPGGDRHRASAWIWAKGRVLLGLGQAAQARAVCEDYLAVADARLQPDTPYNLVRLHDVLREACESLGDFRAALRAHKAAQHASLPLLGHSARARYLSLKLQQAQVAVGAQRAPQSHIRMEALDRSITTLQQSMQQAPAPEADLAEQRRFVAYVGHEIRGALANVMGVNSLLLESPLDQRQSRYVSLATQSVQAALALVNDILDLAKLEAGRFDIVQAPLHIGQLALDLASEFEAQALEKGLHLVCDVASDLPAVRADGLRLRQVLVNLLSNAFKFTAAGQIGLRVERRETTAGLQHIHVAVEDTGEGISADALPLLFGEFSQAGPGADQRHGGSGLGLMLSRQLLRRMGSDLLVRSQPGVGTTFWFTLAAPLAEPAADVAEAQAPAATRQGPAAHRLSGPAP